MIASSSFLRRVLALDAVASGAAGALLAFGGGFLERLTGLEAALAQPAGLFLIAWAAVIAWLALRPVLPGAAVWTVIVVNGLWAVESVLALVLGFVQPTVLGAAFVIAQALAVGLFAQLQFVGLRRSQRLAA